MNNAIAQGHGTRIHRIAVLGNHVPRQCGIATFTTDLSEALSGQFPASDCFVVAMNDGGQSYSYPESVRFEIAEADQPAYLRAADFLNVNEVEITCVQHEYGICRGKAATSSPYPSIALATGSVRRLLRWLAGNNHL